VNPCTLDWGIFGWSKQNSNDACSFSWKPVTVFKALKFSNEEMVQLQRKKKGKMPTTLLVWQESWGVQFSFCGMTLSR
jgi:hypothetical protein